MVIVLLVSGVDAARRNRAYLHLLHADAGAAPASADALLTLRRSLRDGDRAATETTLALVARPDRLAQLLVLHEADRRVTGRDVAGARAALDTLRARTDNDPVLWYRLGEVYERANLPEDAVQCYARGTAGDPAAPWTEGRYRTAMLYQRLKQWRPLVDLLGPLLTTASDAEIVRNIESVQRASGVWQGAFLALGEAHEQLRESAAAEATYERLVRIGAARRDWTLNRALVYLARSKRSHGDFSSALEAVRRALDLATEFDASFRREYELDTAGEAARMIEQARGDGRLAAVRTSIEEMVRRTPDSPAAFFLRGLTSEAACDLGSARSDYGRASSLVRPGSGAFLVGRPIEPARGPCRPR
jgi:tetratricopeptide (TPR) repeat protein